MERLQEAIARARAERHGEVGKLPDFDKQRTAVTPASERGASDQPRPYAPASRKGVNAPPPENIEYSITRQVVLDEAVLEKNRVIAGQHDDQRAEAYRQLRTQVLQTFERHNWSSLAITSPREDAGKTLTAVNLAISLSEETNQTVILVDLDLKTPDVHGTFGVKIDYGVVDIVEGRATVEQALFNPHRPRLVVLPGRPLGRYSSEILTSPAMKNLLRDITSRYDSRLVIFDLPPLLRNDDALKFVPYADATLMVVEEGVNTPEEVERCIHLMRNANFIGTILNKAR
jgi:capsular exopolysaccharide synthesis family protein